MGRLWSNVLNVVIDTQNIFAITFYQPVPTGQVVSEKISMIFLPNFLFLAIVGGVVRRTIPTKFGPNCTSDFRKGLN